MMDNETLQKRIGHFVELKNQIDGVTAGQEELKNDMKADISALETNVKGDISALETNVKGDISALE
jgi:hypothetical protein